MIKILRNGYTVKEVIPHYEITCKHCNAMFECDGTDLRTKTFGHGEYAKVINCPSCHAELDDLYDDGHWNMTNLWAYRRYKDPDMFDENGNPLPEYAYLAHGYRP